MQAHFTLNRLDLPSRYPAQSGGARKLVSQGKASRGHSWTAGSKREQGEAGRTTEESGKRCEMTVN